MDRYGPVPAEDKLSFHNLHTAFIHAVHQACHHCCKCIHCRCLGSFRINKWFYTDAALAEGSQGRGRDLDRLTGKCCRTERLNKFAPQNAQRCTMPPKSRRIFYSCSVVEVSRVLSCLCSANLVPVKHSVSISLVKHYSQATGSRREGGMGKKGGNDREEEVPQLPFNLSSFNKHGLFFSCTEKGARRKQDYQDRVRMKVIKKGDGKGEGGWGVAEDLCAEQKGVQSIIFRQADRLSGEFIFTSI